MKEYELDVLVQERVFREKRVLVHANSLREAKKKVEHMIATGELNTGTWDVISSEYYDSGCIEIYEIV